LGGVLVPPVPIGKAVEYEIFHCKEVDAPWLDPRYYIYSSNGY
jgi:hypothetical protein